VEFREEASVEFSGGSDSTLAAAIGAERLDRVHLLTFNHNGMRKAGKQSAQADNLRRVYGDGKIVEYEGDVNRLLRKVYFNGYLNDILRFGTHVSAFSCVACKLAMDVEAVVYNLKNGVRYLFDGQQREKEMWPMQMEEIIALMQDFFAEYGLVYECPVYDVERTDVELHERGVSETTDVKYRALLKDDPQAAFETADALSHQVSCYGATIPNIFLTGYFIPLWGQERHIAKSKAYYEKKLVLLRKIINERLKEGAK
jgi:hypothetical protein